jgi:hypothetical protein
MLVMETIDGYLPGLASAGNKYAGSSTPLPPIIAYLIRYELPGAPESGSIGPNIDIDVDDYPNEAWANHQLGEEDLMWTATMTVSDKFGNRIHGVNNTSIGTARYYWTSGKRLVTVQSYRVQPDNFLKAYLEKYPSSLQ